MNGGEEKSRYAQEEGEAKATEDRRLKTKVQTKKANKKDISGRKARRWSGMMVYLLCYYYMYKRFHQTAVDIQRQRVLKKRDGKSDPHTR